MDRMMADAIVKHILPLLTSILAAPFATAYPALLQASVKAMKTVIVTGWPRIAHYRGEILKGVIICWCRIGDEEVQSHELNAVLESIKQVVQLLTVAVAQNAEIAEENQNLVDIDGRLRDLLVV